MSKTSSFSSTQPFHNFLGKFQSRRLLLHNPLDQIPETTPPNPNPVSNPAGYDSLDSDAIMVFSFLICAVICSIIINYLIKCLLICISRAVAEDSSENSSVIRSTQNRGVKRKALKTFPVVRYSQDLRLPGLDSECIICLSEFVNGDRVRLLPKCNHGFHVRCIDKWLRSNSSCPKCRHCLLETCEKILDCSSGNSSSAPTMMIQETRVNIVPLEHEDMIRSSE